ncbi:MAG TPA: PEP-CTERM sorting domain-containing protein [Burkholderiaceae bacterium]
MSQCLLVGAGNINGNNQDDAAFLASGWIFVDSTDGSGGAHNGWLTITGNGTQAGGFSINGSSYLTYDRIAIGLKSGNGQLDPDWAIFELADNTFSGTWTISSQSLSHAILYGRGTPGGGGPGTGIPEPGTLALLGLGALAATSIRRRKQQQKT